MADEAISARRRRRQRQQQQEEEESSDTPAAAPADDGASDSTSDVSDGASSSGTSRAARRQRRRRPGSHDVPETVPEGEPDLATALRRQRETEAAPAACFASGPVAVPRALPDELADDERQLLVSSLQLAEDDLYPAEYEPQFIIRPAAPAIGATTEHYSEVGGSGGGFRRVTAAESSRAAVSNSTGSAGQAQRPGIPSQAAMALFGLALSGEASPSAPTGARADADGRDPHSHARARRAACGARGDRGRTLLLPPPPPSPLSPGRVAQCRAALWRGCASCRWRACRGLAPSHSNCTWRTRQPRCRCSEACRCWPSSPS